MEQITDKLISWASILEPKTLAQARLTAQMPFIQPHLALMPDAHLGMGATVGSVIPTHGAIMPAAVGVDIGCGMMAVRTQWSKQHLDSVISGGNTLTHLHRTISQAVPLSAGGANQRLTATAEKRIKKLRALPGFTQGDGVLPRWTFQLGSLGSGNHFIEVSLDEHGRVWLFLHSGSRGVGNRLAQKHIKVSQKQCAAGGIKLPDQDLAYLVEGTPEFTNYIEALEWAQKFALLNREEMMDRVVACLSRFMGQPAQRLEEINCHHNYTERVVLDCDPGDLHEETATIVWLSRKGAINAEFGRLGLIPGSMGDLSYVVRGKGNPKAFWSAPHGAGRNYSRSAAKRRFTREDLNERMLGITWGESDAFLDEHPEAYKPIDQVMRDAADLVEVVHELRQLVNVKGD